MIKAIETEYNGYLFRSRLEARWAVFFDSLNIVYQYEPYFDEVEAGLKYVWYKPDFYLPDLSTFIEIKHKEPNGIEITKAAGWAEIEDIIVFYELRPPTENSESGWAFYWNPKYQKAVLCKHIWWCECPKCGKIGLSYFGELPDTCFDSCYSGSEALYELEEWDRLFGTNLYPEGHKSPRIIAAFKTARRFQFENRLDLP